MNAGSRLLEPNGATVKSDPPQSYYELPLAANAAAQFASQLFEQQPYQTEEASNDDSKNSKVVNLVMQVGF